MLALRIFAMSWIMALIGLAAGNAEAAQAGAFPFMALLVFGSPTRSSPPGPCPAPSGPMPTTNR